MSTLKTYQKILLFPMDVILKKMVDFQNETGELRCLIGLNLASGQVVDGYPIQVSLGNHNFPDAVMVKDKIDDSFFFIAISSISSIRILNLLTFPHIFSDGSCLAPIKKEDQITRLEAKRLVNQAWSDAQIDFHFLVNWESLPSDIQYNNYLKDTVDRLIKIFHDIQKDDLGRESLKSILEFNLEYFESSEIQCSIENKKVLCRFNFDTQSKNLEKLKLKIESLL